MSATAFQRMRREQEAARLRMEAEGNEETDEQSGDSNADGAGDTTGGDNAGEGDNTSTDSNAAESGPDDGENTPVNEPDGQTDAEPLKPAGMTKKQIMAELKALGVPFTDRSSADELRKQLEEKLAEV